MNDREQQSEERGGREDADRRFRRYTAQARRVIDLARAEARQRNHDFLGGEHLLLAIAGDARGNAAAVLAGLRVDPREVIATIEFLVHPGDGPGAAEPAYTGRVARALDLADEEARQRGHGAIGTDELLLGLVREGTNVAAKVLERFGVTHQALRERLGHLGAADREHDAEAGKIKGNVLTCRIDDRDLAVIDALVEAGIRPTRSAAAAWLIHAGIEAHQPLVDKVYAALTDIRRLRDEVRRADPA